jgi:uncharacterized membrane protein YdjX (TVP38/TMEM64 family)
MTTTPAMAKSAHGLHDALTRAGRRAALPYLMLGSVLLLVIVVVGKDIAHHVDAIEATIQRLGPWGPLALVALFVLATSIFVPGTLFTVLAGAVFGFPVGVVAVLAGTLLAAALQYTLSRRLLRARIEHAIQARPSLAAIQHAVTQEELRLQFLLRLTPINAATVSFLLGAAGVRFGGFLLACLALVPALCIEVYFGHSGRHLAGMASAGQRASRLHDVAIVGGIVLCIVVLVLISRLARKALTEAMSERSGSGQSQ